MRKPASKLLAIFMVLMLILGSAGAEEVLSHTLAREMDTVKTKHDNGFIKTEGAWVNSPFRDSAR